MKKLGVRIALALSLTVVAMSGVMILLDVWGSGPLAAHAQAGTGVIRVATTGTDVAGCGSVGNPCRTVQYAVDAASDGDVIKVAQGTYTDIHARAGITQVVYISKTVTIRGGYDATFSAWNPNVYTTTLDAQSQGRALYITGYVSPTVEGLHATGGDAAGLGGDYWNDDAGGGVYVISATATISGCQITGSTAERGGGVYLHESPATLSGNTVSGNQSSQDGGGLYLYSSDGATLSGNTVSGNQSNWYGGGLHLKFSDNAALSGNTISGNQSGWNGGGLYLYYSDEAALSGNTISGNWTTASYGDGGGLYLYRSDGATLSGNTIYSNTVNDDGGGLYMYRSEVTLDNNLIADNQASGNGAGVYVEYLRGTARFRHNTIARNYGGDGSGLYVTGSSFSPSTVAMTNTILVSHTVGIALSGVSTATLEATVWGSGAWGNAQDWSGSGAIFTGTINLWGDPQFNDPATGDYHINVGSAAINAGVDAGVLDDIDGDPRPSDLGYEIGADERPGAVLRSQKMAQPRFFNAGQTITYTIVVTDVGTTGVTNVVLTDTLPLQQQPVTATVSPGSCTLGSGWGAQVVCDLGNVGVGNMAYVTITAQATTTIPGSFPYLMRNTVQARGDNAASETFLNLYMHDCHVRINGGLPEYTEVQPAVDAASEGDTVQIAGVCAGMNNRGGQRQTVYVSQTLILRGGYSKDTFAWDPAAHPTTLHAVGEGRVAYLGGVITPTLDSLRLTGGNANGLGGGSGGQDAGGGVYVANATATISGCQVYSNTAGVGGGLYLHQSPATLSGNTIVSNTTGSSGGGLFLKGSNAALSGNIFSGNTAGGGGGGVSMYQSPATVSGNTFSRNTAGGGGGLELWLSPATVSGNTIVSNTAGIGGGMDLSDSAAMITGNLIMSNTATYDGGGVYASLSPATVTVNIIVSNTAGYDGGGVDMYGSPAILSGNTIQHNTAGADGGGLYLYGNSDAVLNSNTVQHNTAGTRGGGLVLGSNSDATLTGNTIQHNTAGADGGGLYLDGSSDAVLNSNTIQYNAASGEGGGLYVKQSAPTLGSNEVYSNTAGSGGGLYATQAVTLTLTGNTIHHNAATAIGGGIVVTDTSMVDLQANRIQSNSAADGGGLYVFSGVPFTLTNNVVAQNRATGTGDGLWVGGYSPVTTTVGLLRHDTIADNGNSGVGVYVGMYASLRFSNTIIAGHDVGITVTAGSNAVLSYTLWYSNVVADWGGAGVLTSSHPITGSPAFVGGGDYHLTAGSAAIDAGVDAGVTTDLDGKSRDASPDIGAYEFGALDWQIYLPLILRQYKGGTTES